MDQARVTGEARLLPGFRRSEGKFGSHRPVHGFGAVAVTQRAFAAEVDPHADPDAQRVRFVGAVGVLRAKAEGRADLRSLASIVVEGGVQVKKARRRGQTGAPALTGREGMEILTMHD